MKAQTAPSRSLNYVNKKREADRIDRENQKIMDRIINVKPQLAPYEKMRKDYKTNHVQKKKMISRQNDQGICVEDMLEIKR